MPQIGYPLECWEASPSNFPIVRDSIQAIINDAHRRWTALCDDDMPAYKLAATVEYDDFDPDDSGEVVLTMTYSKREDGQKVQPYVWAATQACLEALGVHRPRPHIPVSAEAVLVHLPCQTFRAADFFSQPGVAHRGRAPGERRFECQCGSTHQIRVVRPVAVGSDRM
jgi:hypothetical protein